MINEAGILFVWVVYEYASIHVEHFWQWDAYG